jgi:hypothetical protein
MQGCPGPLGLQLDTLSTAADLLPSCKHNAINNIHLLYLCLQALDRWEERLEALFEGRPYDELDATLTDTLSQFPVDIQPFRWAGVLWPLVRFVPGPQKQLLLVLALLC